MLLHYIPFSVAIEIISRLTSPYAFGWEQKSPNHWLHQMNEWVSVSEPKMNECWINCVAYLCICPNIWMDTRCWIYDLLSQNLLFNNKLIFLTINTHGVKDSGEWTGHVPRTNTHTQIAVIKYRFSSVTWDWAEKRCEQRVRQRGTQQIKIKVAMRIIEVQFTLGNESAYTNNVKANGKWNKSHF